MHLGIFKLKENTGYESFFSDSPFKPSFPSNLIAVPVASDKIRGLLL